MVTYGPNVPANGVSGPLGTLGAGLDSDWTAGIYFVVGTPSITDPAGFGLPVAPLSSGIGTGSTAQFDSVFAPVAGEFAAPQEFDTGGVAGDTITAEVVAYPTTAGSYASALFRAHSAPFAMPTISNVAIPVDYVGIYMPAFSVNTVPEPSTLALAGLGASLLLAWVRRKSF